MRAADPTNPNVNQMDAKFRLQRSLRGIQGSCLWYSAALVRNEGNYANALCQKYHRAPALQPLFPFIDNEAPGKPRKVKAMWMPDGYYLFWTAPKGKREMDRARNYVVYRFAKGERIDLYNTERIVAITPQTLLKLPYQGGHEKYTYVVTALDRLQNESKGKKVNVKL